MVSRNFNASIGYSMVLSVEIKFKFCMRFIKLLFAFYVKILLFYYRLIKQHIFQKIIFSFYIFIIYYLI